SKKYALLTILSGRDQTGGDLGKSAGGCPLGTPRPVASTALKDVANLNLERARRIDVGERRQRVRLRVRHRDDLAERRARGARVAVGRLRASEDVAVIEEVEAFESQQNRTALLVEPSFDEERHILRARAAERALADDDAVDDGAVVVRAVAVVVHAGRRVE